MVFLRALMLFTSGEALGVADRSLPALRSRGGGVAVELVDSLRLLRRLPGKEKILQIVFLNLEIVSYQTVSYP